MAKKKTKNKKQNKRKDYFPQLQLFHFCDFAFTWTLKNKNNQINHETNNILSQNDISMGSIALVLNLATVIRGRV